MSRPLILLLAGFFLFQWGTKTYGADPAILITSAPSVTPTPAYLIPNPTAAAPSPSASSPTLVKPTPTRTPVATGKYVVKQGDSLWTISRQNGITVDALRSANNLKSDLLHVGDELVIPPKSQ